MAGGVVTWNRNSERGSFANPWPSVDLALDKVGGGNTIVLKRGEYRGPITMTAKAAGTMENPAIIKSEKKWEVAVSVCSH